MHAIRLHGERHIATVIHNERRGDLARRLPQPVRAMVEIFPRCGLVSILKEHGPASRGFLQRFDKREPSHDVRVNNYVDAVKDLPTRWN
jgi:hypothetical protein